MFEILASVNQSKAHILKILITGHAIMVCIYCKHSYQSKTSHGCKTYP